MPYYYHSHMGGYYSTIDWQDPDDLYCETCGDSDVELGEYEDDEEFFADYPEYLSDVELQERLRKLLVLERLIRDPNSWVKVENGVLCVDGTIAIDDDDALLFMDYEGDDN